MRRPRCKRFPSGKIPPATASCDPMTPTKGTAQAPPDAAEPWLTWTNAAIVEHARERDQPSPSSPPTSPETNAHCSSNVISEVARPAPSGKVISWLNEQESADLCVATITLGEISYAYRGRSCGIEVDRVMELVLGRLKIAAVDRPEHRQGEIPETLRSGDGLRQNASSLLFHRHPVSTVEPAHWQRPSRHRVRLGTSRHRWRRGR